MSEQRLSQCYQPYRINKTATRKQTDQSKVFVRCLMATFNLSTVLARNVDRLVRMYISYMFGFLILYTTACIKIMHNLSSILD